MAIRLQNSSVAAFSSNPLKTWCRATSETEKINKKKPFAQSQYHRTQLNSTTLLTTKEQKLFWSSGFFFSVFVLYIQHIEVGQNGCHFANYIFNPIFLWRNCSVFIQTSLKFVPNGSINNKPALVFHDKPAINNNDLVFLCIYEALSLNESIVNINNCNSVIAKTLCYCNLLFD